jgi:class 3 adenylate cyclase
LADHRLAADSGRVVNRRLGAATILGGVAGHTEQDPIPQLGELVDAARKEAEDVAQHASSLQVIAFFDLSDSTRAKMTVGNAAASRAVLTFTSLASSITARFGGQVIKTLGDGVLATFSDPLAACRTALNLRYATHELLRLKMTAGLTSGRPLSVALDGHREDVLGDVVDRAARIQSLARPGQVLIDAALHSQIRADIAGQRGWKIDSAPRRTHAKGIGTIELFEVCLDTRWRLKKELATPFDLITSGRPSLSEKLALINNAKSEIIEIGIGLTSFAQYFTGQKPEEFRDPIRQLVRTGVNLKCFALDFGHEPGRAWLAEQDNPDYPEEAVIARRRIEGEGRHYSYEEYRGGMYYHTYRRIPEFWCLGVDVDDALDGRMFFAPYLMGVPRSALPVVQVSRTSNPELYEKYLDSVHALRAASDENRE